ncbi:MAG TPA: DUF4159 domain-containing protein [Alphaproteobacteria bacterium]|nr:DUF4159 domain-containing protein [Alphaproteobacteria bacterium]
MPFGHLVFASPYILGFLATLPLLWWLLRLTPPSPKKIEFPALSLLRDLVKPEQTPARTPWWLLLLRLIIAALIIVAFAGPVINPAATISGNGALLIAIDNDWAAARDWDARTEALHNILNEAAQAGCEVYLLPTTPAASGAALQITGPVAAKAALAQINAIKPEPWPADWASAAKLAENLGNGAFSSSIWLSSGLGGTDANIFYTALHDAGDTRVFGDAGTPIYLLTPPQSDDSGTSIAVLRADTSAPAQLAISALDRSGHALTHMPINFPVGSPRATASLDMPLDMRNQVSRFEIEGLRTAGATVLLDASWEHRPVGLVGDQTEIDRHSLLSGLFYLDRALKPYADLHVDDLSKLLAQPLAVLIKTDATDISADQMKPLTDWVKKGGVLVQFAGDRMSADENAQNDLLPVTLRMGDRSLGGSLSWATPQALQIFPTGSPFHGIAIPKDVTVSRQILAEPAPELASRTWAALADGTPLVTAKPLGAGLTILFHVPARSDWSNLPLSGLFVDMLRRIVDLSHGGGDQVNTSALPPLAALDAFGEQQKPGAAAEPITGDDLAHVKVGPQHPPGLYGTDAMNRAFNLGTALAPPLPLNGVSAESYRQETKQYDLQSLLLATAFILFLLDFALSLYLRGFFVRRAPVVALLLALLFASHAQAADPVELTSKTTLAYVQTGNRETDKISEAGLATLARVIQNRTSIDEVAVIGVDPDRDELAFYPFLYWPLVPGEAALSPTGAKHMNDYLHHGGMIVFDSMSGEMPPPSMTQQILAGIDLPPMVKLPENHVLHRSFYLLDAFPGRYASEELWLEPEEASSYDGVATVISGTNGWAAAWAADDQGRFMYPCVPGGDAQRERAFRFGVNILMYALTGNYKSDQLHAQALLKRMGK